MVLGKIAFILATLFYFTESKQQSLIMIPSNEAKVIGDSVTFECRTNSGSTLVWELTDLPEVFWQISDGPNIINPRFAERFSIITSPAGNYGLNIIRTSMEDAGRYRCRDRLTGDSASALYVVLRNMPVCQSSIEGLDSILIDSTVNLTCKVEYNGTICMKPQFLWTDHSGTEHQSTKIVEPPLSIISTLSFPAQPPIVKFICTIHFGTPTTMPVIEDESRSTATFTHPWHGNSVEIIYSPRNIQFEGLIGPNNNIYIDESLCCNADANPDPVINWYDENEMQSFGRCMVMDSLGTKRYTCTATNHFNGVPHPHSHTISVEVIPKPPDETVAAAIQERASYIFVYSIFLACAEHLIR